MATKKKTTTRKKATARKKAAVETSPAVAETSATAEPSAPVTEEKPIDKRLSRRKRSGLKRYDQTLSQGLYDLLHTMADEAKIDYRAYVEKCLRDSPAVKRYLKTSGVQLPDRPLRGNPKARKK